MSDTNYHDRPEVSATMLKSMDKGWRDFEAEHITKTAPLKETASMSLGTAVHAALLEPDVFSYYVTPPPEASDRRTKAGKAWYAENAGKPTLTPKDRETVERIVAACDRSAIVQTVLQAAGESEKEVFWTCDVTSVDCRCKIDRWVPRNRLILDVKTTDDAKPEAFRHTIGKYRYDLQAAHYLDSGVADEFVFIAVETSSPFRVRLFEMADTDLDDARELRHELLTAYQQRKGNNDWSEPGEDRVVKLFLPSYMKAK